MLLRQFGPADYADLISWLRTPEDLYIFTGPLLSFPLTPDQLDDLRADAAITAFTAVEGAEAVGHVELVSTGEGEARIARVLVDPAMRGRGLGELLLLAVIAEARGLGIRMLTLRVVPTNGPARALYEKLGFVYAGEDDRFLIMRRDAATLPPTGA